MHFKPLSITATLRLSALAVTLAIFAAALWTALSFRDASIEQHLATTRAVVLQAQAIAERYHQLERTGKLGAAQAREQAIGEIKAIRYNGQEYVWINDMHPRMVAHPFKPELDGQDLSDNKDPTGFRLFVAFADLVRTRQTGHVDYLWPRPGASEPVPKRSYVAGFQPWGWVIGSGVYVDEVREAAWHFAAVNFIVAGVVGAGLFTLVHLLSRSLRRRLSEASAALEAIASGELGHRIEPGRDDEIGELMRGIDRTAGALRRMVSQVRSAADGISTASAEIATGSLDLSARTEQTAANLQQTSASMEQLTGIVRESAQSADAATELARSAARVAEDGGQVVSRVVATMEDINVGSRRIADIISTIDGIAFQTNILALNAAVEAARAGSEGRGFAVVAGEVRTLAQRSAEAAREIRVLIGESVERVAAGSRLVGEAGTTMNDIVSSVRRVSDLIGRISASAQAQSHDLGQVNGAVDELDQMTQQNAAMVEQSAAAAASLREQAAGLVRVVADFRLEADRRPA